MYQGQPNPDMLNNVVPFPFWVKDFFTTNLHPHYHIANKDAVDKMTGSEGHIVIRVAPGGGEFYVYMLDDNDLIFKVKSIHGPYTSR